MLPSEGNYFKINSKILFAFSPVELAFDIGSHAMRLLNKKASFIIIHHYYCHHFLVRPYVTMFKIVSLEF